MKFIPESTIDRIVDQMESQSDQADVLIKQLGDQYPLILAYLFSESFELLTREESNYLLYLSLVVCQAITAEGAVPDETSPDEIAIKEEANWERLKSSSERKFRERISPFFEDYPQEDLLAFVEDALVYDEEDSTITNEGREYLFVTMKTIIDSLCDI